MAASRTPRTRRWTSALAAAALLASPLPVDATTTKGLKVAAIPLPSPDKGKKNNAKCGVCGEEYAKKARKLVYSILKNFAT